jgi:hypothetical protein
MQVFSHFLTFFSYSLKFGIFFLSLSILSFLLGLLVVSCMMKASTVFRKQQKIKLPETVSASLSFRLG